MLDFFLTLLCIYALPVGLLFVFQRRLLYQPSKILEAPWVYGLSDFSEHFITGKDGVSLQLWYRAAAPGFPTITYFHGNAFNLSGRVPIYGMLAEKGFGVLALSYRGYGKSTGAPTEQGLYNDARTAIHFLTNQQRIQINRIMLYGESLGTGVATQMATECNVGAIILQAAYTSIAARAAELYRWVPVRLLMRDRYNTLARVGRIKAPLLLFHGERNDIIPIAHGKAVFAAATAPKEAVFFPHVTHNDFDSTVISAHVLDFARKHKLIEA